MQNIDTIRIDLPNSWRQVPADRAGMEVVTAAMRATAQWASMKPSERRQFELLLQRLVIDAEGVGVRFAAVYSDVPDAASVGDEAAADDGAETAVANAAYLVVSVLSSADIGTTLPLTPAVLESALSMQRPPTNGSATHTNLAPPEPVTIQAGPAVVLRRLVEQRFGRDTSLQFYSHAYFVPVPDAPDRLVVLQFLTPHVGEAELFGRYFAAVSNGLRFYAEGEPTTL